MMPLRLNSVERKQWLLLLALLLILGASMTANIYHEHHRTNLNERERLLTQAKVVQENLISNLDALNKTLLHLANDKNILLFNQSYNQRLDDLSDAMPGIRTIFVMDHTGTIRISNRPELIGRNLKERDYFNTPKQQANKDMLFISPPFKTVLGTYVINISRIIYNQDKEFAGIVTAALDPEYFKTLLASVRYKEDMWTYIAHSNGTLFMIEPDRYQIAGKNLSDPGSFLMRHLASGSNSSINSGLSYATNEQRLVAMQTVQPEKLKMNRPLVVAVSRDHKAIFQTWFTDTLLHIGLYLLFATLTSTLLFFYHRHRRNVEREKEESKRNIMELHQELDQFFSMALDLLCIATIEGHFKKLNRSWEETLGYNLDELVGQRFLDFVHPDDIPSTLAAMSELDNKKQLFNFTNRYRCKDGSYRWIEWRATPHLNLIYAAARDITERKLAEKTLKKNERFLRTLTDIIPGLVGYWDKDLRNTFANISYLEWFEKTPEEMHGIHIRDLMGDELFSKNEPFMRAALRGERQRFERTLTKPDGSTSHTWAHYIPDIDGTDVRGFFVLVSDVTELKQTQLQLEQLNEELSKRTVDAEGANRAKSEFLANMSHEIRTPMNAILGLTRLVLETELTERQADYLQKVYGSSQALLSILNDILDYSKIEAGKLEIENLPISVKDLINDTVELFSARIDEKGLAISIDFDTQLPELVMGDPLRISQIMNNLVGNSVKFTETGEIGIKAELAADEGETLKIRFAVRDTGIGLSKAESDRLFHAFTQADGTISRKYGGTGLGLTISQRLVRLMGGDIDVSSVEGAGATFSFVIQVDKAPQGSQAARKRHSIPALAAVHTGSKPGQARPLAERKLSGARILLVEDNRINQDVAAEFLRKQGAVVALADHGGEALDMIKSPCFDLVLMDLHMPVMDGFEATRKIREFYGNADLPIIAMTAAVMQDDRNRCAAAGMVDFVAKPINPEELTQVLQKWLKQQDTSAIPLASTVPADRPKPMESMSSFDRSAALRRLNGNHELLDSLLMEFVKDHSADGHAIHEMLSQGRTDEALRLTHTIKGVAGTIGATTLAEAAGTVEQQLRSGESPTDFDRIDQAMAAAIAEIRAAFPELAPTADPDIQPQKELEQKDVTDLAHKILPYVVEQELVPEELLAQLNALILRTGNPILKKLQRQMDRFDHAGALATLNLLQQQ